MSKSPDIPSLSYFDDTFCYRNRGSAIYHLVANVAPQLTYFDRNLLVANVSSITPPAVQEFNFLMDCDSQQAMKSKHLICLLLMNIVNIADETAESNPRLSTELDDLISYPILENNSLMDWICHIQRVATKSDVNTNIIPPIKSVIETQVQGTKLIARSNREGKIVYSVKQAIDYRIGTLGVYYGILARIGLLYPRDMRRFYQQIMELQHADDMSDMSEDLSTQCNPFVAILEEANLLYLLREYPYTVFVDLITSAALTLSQRTTLTEQSEHVRAAYLAY